MQRKVKMASTYLLITSLVAEQNMTSHYIQIHRLRSRTEKNSQINLKYIGGIRRRGKGAGRDAPIQALFN